jgi:hypothetical protein
MRDARAFLVGKGGSSSGADATAGKRIFDEVVLEIR